MSSMNGNDKVGIRFDTKVSAGNPSGKSLVTINRSELDKMVPDQDLQLARSKTQNPNLSKEQVLGDMIADKMKEDPSLEGRGLSAYTKVCADKARTPAHAWQQKVLASADDVAHAQPAVGRLSMASIREGQGHGMQSSAPKMRSPGH